MAKETTDIESTLKDPHAESVRLKFAHVLKRERIKSGKSSKEFGIMMGFKDHHMLNKYENAEIKTIPVSTYVKLAEVTKIPYQDIVSECMFDLGYNGIESEVNKEK